MENYQISGSKIIFETGNVIEFDFPIFKTVVFNNSIIIVLDIVENIKFNRNAYAITFVGNVKWQIEESANLDLIGYCPFTGIYTDEGKLVFYNWCGFRYIVNPESGKIIDIMFTK